MKTISFHYYWENIVREREKMIFYLAICDALLDHWYREFPREEKNHNLCLTFITSCIFLSILFGSTKFHILSITLVIDLKSKLIPIWFFQSISGHYFLNSISFFSTISGWSFANTNQLLSSDKALIIPIINDLPLS